MLTAAVHRILDRAVGAIERQDWLDRVGDPTAQAITSAFESAGPPGRAVKSFLHGSWLGHPLHAVLTDIPIGAWTATVILDALEDLAPRGRAFRRSTENTLMIGIVGAVASAVAGVTDWQHLHRRPQRIGIVHALLNTIGLGLMSASYGARKRNDHRQGRRLARAGFATVVASAYLGGHLSYRKRIGVDHSLPREAPRDFTPVLRDADLAEGRPQRVQANDVRIVLVRKHGRVYALGEVCAHLGGPLSEGSLVGDSIQCPWHGSRFALEDGAVVEGPATASQPCFETRVRDGQIEVRFMPRREMPLRPAERAFPAKEGRPERAAEPGAAQAEVGANI